MKETKAKSNKLYISSKTAESGITLIALIITIIILLILAGISIATLTGENGILTQIQEAKSANDESRIREHIELAVLYSRINEENPLKLNLTMLENELKKFLGEDVDIEKQGEESELPWIVTEDGYRFIIKEDGSVEKVNGIALSKTNIKMIQGGTETITATLYKGTTGRITWTSSDENVVTVDEGKIIAVGTSGTTTTVTAKVEGTDIKAECIVTIVSEIIGITVDDIEIEQGSSKEITIETTPKVSESLEEITYKYISSNEDIAIVNTSGKIIVASDAIVGDTVVITVTGIGNISGVKVMDEFTVTVLEGTTFDASELTIGEAKNSNKYGWRVQDYTVTTDDFQSGVWRLFFQDDNYTYLITDESVGTYDPSQYYLNYIDGSYVKPVGQKLNPKLLEKGTFFVSNNTNENIRATAWLTDNEAALWKQYENEDTEFAIGSPTYELFIASFNATAEQNGTTKIEVGDIGAHGYIPTSSKILKESYNKGIYNCSSSEYWWIASPYFNNWYSNRTYYVMTVNGSSNCFSNENASGSKSVRPIVCMKTEVFNEKYLDGVIEDTQEE